MITVLHPNNFYPAFGLSKMQEMLEDKNQHFREAPAKMAEAIRNMAALAGTHEKEGDWAIMGGLAQGIGGIGAGIAAAADTQIKNAEIRQRNARRDAQASQLNNIANQVSATRLGLIDINDALSDWQVSVDEDTKSLFKQLCISAGKIEYGGQVNITFSMYDSSCPYKVDGYLKMKKYSMQGRLIDEKIVPIPIWEKGNNQAVLNCIVKESGSADVKLEFEPYILWKISTDTHLKHYTRAFRVEELEAGNFRDNFLNYWREVESAEAKAKRAKKTKKWIVTFSVLALCALVIALIVTSIKTSYQDQIFSYGVDYIGYPSSDFYSCATEYFSQLPSSYDGRIVDACMRQARKDFPDAKYDSELDRLLFLLNTASSKVASDSELIPEISDMEIRIMIKKKDPSVSEKIISAYKRGDASFELVAEYAETIYSLSSSQNGNEMVSTLAPMLEALLPEDPNFQALIDKYETVEAEYWEAVALFEKKDFESCKAFFAEHQDYRNSIYYLSLCEGVEYWCGTWKDNAGNTFKIVPDQSMDVYYLDFGWQGCGLPQPWRVYVRIYDNGQDVTEYLMSHEKHYVIQEDNQQYRDKITTNQLLCSANSRFHTYSFTRGKSTDDGCSILKYDGDDGDAKQVWRRHYYKVDN